MFAFKRPESLRRSDYLVPPPVVKNLTTGLQVQASDSFWIRSVQDFDHCDQPINDRECHGKSWLFNVLDLTTDLDTKFYEPFYYGGLALTVIISDYDGASKIFDKGVAAFPKRWKITYAAGYHALFEEKDKVKASKLFLQTAENGGPPWLKVSAGTLAAEGGDANFAKQIIEGMLVDNDDPKLIERLKNKMNQVERRDRR